LIGFEVESGPTFPGQIRFHLGGSFSPQYTQVIHKAVVDVMEEGTVAAAATGVSARFMSFRPSFKADHPFLYSIIHRRTKTLVFIGRMSRPANETVSSGS